MRRRVLLGCLLLNALVCLCHFATWTHCTNSLRCAFLSLRANPAPLTVSMARRPARRDLVRSLVRRFLRGRGLERVKRRARRRRLAEIEPGGGGLSPAEMAQAEAEFEERRRTLERGCQKFGHSMPSAFAASPEGN